MSAWKCIFPISEHVHVSVGVNDEIKEQSFSYVKHTHTPLRVWEWIPSPPASGGLFQLLGHDVCVMSNHSYGAHLPVLVRRLRGPRRAAFPAARSAAASGGRLRQQCPLVAGWGEACGDFFLFFFLSSFSFSFSETFLQVKALTM